MFSILKHYKLTTEYEKPSDLCNHQVAHAIYTKHMKLCPCLKTYPLLEEHTYLDSTLRYVNNFVEKRFHKLVFVKTTQNIAHHLTKNINGETYEANVNKFIVRRNLIEGCNCK
jgi:hypothetical protein